MSKLSKIQLLPTLLVVLGAVVTFATPVVASQSAQSLQAEITSVESARDGYQAGERVAIEFEVQDTRSIGEDFEYRAVIEILDNDGSVPNRSGRATRHIRRAEAIGLRRVERCARARLPGTIWTGLAVRHEVRLNRSFLRC